MDELSVSDHLELQAAWHGEVGLQRNWLYSLETLKLENCEIPAYAIPSHVLPCLKSLKELKVRNCNVRVIFEMNDTEIEGTAFQLKKLILEELRDLMDVWEKNLEAIRSFQNLQQVVVSGCDNLETLFPAALAKNLKKLEKLEIWHCKKLLGIVGKEEEEEAAAEESEKFVFPRLTSLDLYMLRQLAYFYPESFTLECPDLIHLHVLYCNELELFQSQQEAHPEGEGSTSINRQPLFPDLKAISNLEQLSLNWKDTSVLRSRFGQLFTEEEDLQYLNQLNLYFDDDVNEESTLPFEILEKAPNLETIAVSCCSNLKERFPSQIVANRMLGHLKSLLLDKLFELQCIGSEYTSWLNTICDKLHELHVQSCPHLTTLLHSDSAVSFSYLKVLNISECHGLKNLFPSSTAIKLMHLEEMCVEECESLKEIMAEEQDETTSEEIKFERLEKIVLGSLPSLECFYSGNATLQLPSLIQVDIVQCPKMKTFSEGVMVAESFRGIQVAVDSNDDVVFDDDLNATVKKPLFLRQEHLVLADYPDLEEIWLGVVPVQDKSFSSLKSLVVEGCEFLSAALPSHLLPFLINLEELKVQKCDSIETIFDVKDTPTHHASMGPASPLQLPLKKLILKQLPKLKLIWYEDPQGSLSLPFLEEVFVDECQSIRSLFPTPMAKDRLQKLGVKNCAELVEIVAQDEAATEEAIVELIMFQSVTSLRLWNLPNLKCIYPGMHILEWPMLKELDVFHCQMLKIFATEFQNSPVTHPEGQDRFPTDQQSLISLEKVTPNLETMSLNKDDAMMIEQGQLFVDFQNLKFLQLQCFHDESDVFPYVFLSKVQLPSILTLGLFDSAFKEIFPSQRLDIEYTKILSQLKGLELSYLPMLNSIGLEHSWMGPFLKNLETLVVLECNFLTNLVPSTVSFSQLIELIVEGCYGLKYLFTSSTAKSLCALKKIYITECVSLEEIVAQEEDERGDGEIIFEQLKILSLSSLPRLRSFYYTGSSTLIFPSLKEVSFTRCHNMKIFCHGDVVVPEDLEGEIDGVRWKGDINTAIKQQFGGKKQPEFI